MSKRFRTTNRTVANQVLGGFYTSNFGLCPQKPIFVILLPCDDDFKKYKIFVTERRN